MVFNFNDRNTTPLVIIKMKKKFLELFIKAFLLCKKNVCMLLCDVIYVKKRSKSIFPYANLFKYNCDLITHSNEIQPYLLCIPYTTICTLHFNLIITIRSLLFSA